MLNLDHDTSVIRILPRKKNGSFAQKVRGIIPGREGPPEAMAASDPMKSMPHAAMSSCLAREI